MSFNSVKNYCWCGTHHYPRALGKAGIPLPTNPLVRGGGGLQERDVGLNGHLGHGAEREKEGGDRLSTEDRGDRRPSCTKAQPLFCPFPRKLNDILEETWKTDLL